MGNAAATRAGLPQAPIPINASVNGILYQVIDYLPLHWTPCMHKLIR